MTSVLTFVSVLAVQTALAASPIYQPRMVDTKTYSETNTVIAWLSDGTYIQSQLAISNLSLRGGRGACRVLMVRPGSPAWTADTVVDRDGWSSTTKPVPTLRVGPCKATSSGQVTTLDARLDGTSVSIALSASAESSEPPGYPLHVGERFYESDVLVPFAPVEVVLEPAQGEAQVLKGFGYADHSRSTSLPKDLARGWLRFRGFADKCSTVLSVRLPPEGGPAAGYWWRRGARAPEALVDPAVTMPDEDRQTLPFDMTVHSGKRPFRITGRQLLFRDAPLESHGVLGRMVGAFVGRVVTKTYAAVLHDDGPCGDIHGVMELEWAGS